MILRRLGFSLLLLVSGRAMGFPDLIRHGYTNCIACHVSPNGGGVLTKYGRSLSKELLSTWGREGEEKFAYFAKTSPQFALPRRFARKVQSKEAGSNKTTLR
jgi:hypothetical protein